jgi:hypothetical protein
MKRSRSARLLSVEGPGEKRAEPKTKEKRPTSFDHTKIATAERIIIVNTTHNQSDPPIVRWRAAAEGLTWIGLAIS